MREIKYRAWFMGKMWEVTCLEFLHGVTYIRGKCGAEEMQLSDENCEAAILIQFTSLRDKNGEEIYEGDIVKDTVNGGFGFIEYDAKHMKFAIRPGWFNPVYQMGYPKDREIIGNIHENPELLA